MAHESDYVDEREIPQEQWWAWRARDAINERLDDLGWNQQELVKRSGVSATTVRWLQQGELRIYRAATLSRVSKALGWPGGALAKVLKGESVPEFETDNPPVVSGSDVLNDALADVTPGRSAALSGIDISDLDADDQALIRSQIDFLRQRRQSRSGE